MYLFNIEIDYNFFALWGLQAVLMFSFLALSQVFVMLFGHIGMIFNIALTAIQLVSSGAIVPRELLSSFYQGISKVLPATYGVNSYFSFKMLIWSFKSSICQLNSRFSFFNIRFSALNLLKSS